MNRNVKKTVYKVLLEDEYSRSNDNYLIVKVAQELEPDIAGSTFIKLMNSKLSFESITRARRSFFKKYPELKPKKITEIREKEEEEYHLEYGGINRTL